MSIVNGERPITEEEAFGPPLKACEICGKETRKWWEIRRHILPEPCQEVHIVLCSKCFDIFHRQWELVEATTTTLYLEQNAPELLKKLRAKHYRDFIVKKQEEQAGDN